jgi:hypothetical protein
MTILKPGIHLGISDEVYHADPCERPSLSSGIMNRLLTQSALHAHFHHPRLNPQPVKDEADDVTERGQLAHRLLLGGAELVVPVDPREFPAEKTGNIPEGWTNKAIRTERERIRALGKTPVFLDAFNEALTMAAAARVALAECEIPINLADGDTEVVGVWEDGPVLCRMKVDWWSKDRDLQLDYKSTAGLARPDLWARRQMGPLGYDVQAQHYRRGGHVLTHHHQEWLWLVQENFPPYACSVITMSGAMEEIAEKKREFAMVLWHHSITTGKWPGYSNRVAYIEPTTWQMEEHERTIDDMLELGEQG